MWHEERRQRIRTLLGTFGRITIDRATDELGVSRETIRRDLLEMEAGGELRRVRGGAIAADSPAEAPYPLRSAVRMREKRMIAAAAVQLVRSGQTLFLDAGSTTAITLAERLAGLSGLTVVTNSVEVAQKIAGAGARGNRAVLLGGAFSEVPAATYGAATINDLNRYRADLALLSPFGLDPAKGATSYDPREAEIARAMCRNAAETVILADHSKLGVCSRVAFCATDEIGCLVMDARAERNPLLGAFRQAVPRVLIASRL